MKGICAISRCVPSLSSIIPPLGWNVQEVSWLALTMLMRTASQGLAALSGSKNPQYWSSITWELVGNAESEAPPQTDWIKTVTLQRDTDKQTKRCRQICLPMSLRSTALVDRTNNKRERAGPPVDLTHCGPVDLLLALPGGQVKFLLNEYKKRFT